MKNHKKDFENANLIRQLAGRHCNRGERDCRWYHGNWELLKLLGVVSTSAVHAKDMVALLESAQAGGNPVPRILLSGSTDATLLQIVASTYKDCARQLDITAVDICATPLELMSKFARDNGLTFSSTRADILEYHPDQHFDIILTHAFMGNFDEESRALLVRKWASMLCDGGSVVTVQRVRPVESPPVIRFSGDQSKNFINAAITAAGQVGELQAADLARIETAARVFTENFMSHAITSKTGLEQLFIDAGLTLRHLEYRSLARKTNLGGPSVPSGGEYAFIIAQKGESL